MRNVLVVLRTENSDWTWKAENSARFRCCMTAEIMFYAESSNLIEAVKKHNILIQLMRWVIVDLISFDGVHCESWTVKMPTHYGIWIVLLLTSLCYFFIFYRLLRQVETVIFATINVQNKLLLLFEWTQAKNYLFPFLYSETHTDLYWICRIRQINSRF